MHPLGRGPKHTESTSFDTSDNPSRVIRLLPEEWYHLGWIWYVGRITEH
jgi:hypothetical protein